MERPVFADISLEYKDEWNRRIISDNVGACDYAFTNCFIWSEKYNGKIASWGNCMMVSCEFGDRKRFYSFPVGGSDEEKESMLLALRETEEEFALCCVTKEQADWLDNHFPGEYEMIPYRDAFDYVYDTEILATLPGRHFAGKRNHIKHFLEGGTWEFTKLKEEDVPACLNLDERWMEERLRSGKEESVSYEEERKALIKALTYRNELGIEGYVLWQNGVMVAFTLASVQTEDQITVHFEKAAEGVRGAYQMINREFAAIQKGRFSVINREDDTGDPGLRFAKSSYHGYRLLEKYTAFYGQYAYANETNRMETENLYLSAFNDPPSLAGFFISHHRILKRYEKGHAACQAALIPCRIKTENDSVPAIYLYALSTDPDYSGQGFATEFIRHIEERYQCPVILVPETEKLISFYEKRGFKVFISSPGKIIERTEEKTEEEKTVPGQMPEDGEEESITAWNITDRGRKYIMKKLLSCRKSFCENAGDVVWDEEELKYALEDHLLADGQIAELSDGGMIWYVKNGDVLIIASVMDEKENEPAAFSALLLSEDAVSAEIPALTVMVCGYDKPGGRMDMTLA